MTGGGRATLGWVCALGFAFTGLRPDDLDRERPADVLARRYLWAGVAFVGVLALPYDLGVGGVVLSPVTLDLVRVGATCIVLGDAAVHALALRRAGSLVAWEADILGLDVDEWRDNLDARTGLADYRPIPLRTGRST